MPSRRPQPVFRCSQVASRMTMSRSAVTWARASGRWTLSTTEVPSRRAPVWTCATEAAASGSSSTPAKTSGSGRPSSDSTALATTGHGDAGTSDCSWASSRANAGPDEVRTGGQHLAELDERDPAVGQRLPDRPGHAGVGLAGGDAASAAQVSAEAVLRRDGDDPRIPAAPAPPRRQASQPGDRPGEGAGGDDRLEDDQDRQPEGDRPGQAQEDEEQGLDGVDLGGEVSAAGLDRPARRPGSGR